MKLLDKLANWLAERLQFRTLVIIFGVICFAAGVLWAPILAKLLS